MRNKNTFVVGSEYYENELKLFANSQETNLVKSSNSIIGSSSTQVGTYSYSINYNQTNIWFVYSSKDDNKNRRFRCVYNEKSTNYKKKFLSHKIPTFKN